MKYEDIVKIFDEIYYESNDDEMDCLREWLDATHKRDDKVADFYKRMAYRYRYEGKGMMKLFNRIVELAKQSGENTSM